MLQQDNKLGPVSRGILFRRSTNKCSQFDGLGFTPSQLDDLTTANRIIEKLLIAKLEAIESVRVALGWERLDSMEIDDILDKRREEVKAWAESKYQDNILAVIKSERFACLVGHTKKLTDKEFAALFEKEVGA